MSTATLRENQSKPVATESLFDALKLYVRYPTPWMIFAVCVAAAGWRFALGGGSRWDLAIIVAIAAVWPVQEWLIHVFVLHFKPFEIAGRKLDLHLASEHRDHHERPWDVPKVFVPMRAVLLGVFVGVPVILYAWSQLGQLEHALTFIATYFLLGSVYEWVHFLVHTAYKPKSRLYKRLWRNHRLHHFKNENYWYGVTRLEGDLLLGTSPKPGDVEKSETARSII